MTPDEPPIAPGTELDLDVERVAVGGRMIARHRGRIVLVAGAIPGEGVRARVERVRRDVIYASVTAVHRAHPARRSPGRDPACGGMTFAHVEPSHQRALKAQAIADAFTRIGRIELTADVPVAESPETAYRMRARVHLRQGLIGSFREGSHDICDVAQTGQLSDSCVATLVGVAELCARHGVHHVEAIDVAENLDGTQRVLNVEQPEPGVLPPALFPAISALDGVTGVTQTTRRGSRPRAHAGRAWVEDPLDAFLLVRGDDATCASIRRHATAFFQTNRFLTPALARRVTDALLPGPVIDLYSGVGLFALCAAVRGHDLVVAIEGEAVSAADLEANAQALGPRILVERLPVEVFLRRGIPSPPSTVIVDPPRTGMSRDAIAGVVALEAPRLVYVSCDVATLARDARRFLDDGGYRLERLSAFDLFPNTPHVEVLAVFDLA